MHQVDFDLLGVHVLPARSGDLWNAFVQELENRFLFKLL
jgi:hypothetical protein